MLKNKSLVIIAFIILVFSIFGCKKNTTTPSSIINKYSAMGQLHNEGLDFILNNLFDNCTKTKNEGLTIDACSLMAIVKESVIMFSEKNKLYPSIITKDGNFDMDYIYSIIEQNGSNDNFFYFIDYVNCSQVQINFFLQIQEALNNPNNDIAACIQKITSIENEIAHNCNQSDYDLLLTATLIAKSSLRYWEDNFNKWAKVLVYQNEISKTEDWAWFRDTIIEMGKCDLLSGVIGCIGGPAGAVAGACYGSAASGISELAKHWGLW